MNPLELFILGYAIDRYEKSLQSPSIEIDTTPRPEILISADDTAELLNDIKTMCDIDIQGVINERSKVRGGGEQKRRFALRRRPVCFEQFQTIAECHNDHFEG